MTRKERSASPSGIVECKGEIAFDQGAKTAHTILEAT